MRPKLEIGLDKNPDFRSIRILLFCRQRIVEICPFIFQFGPQQFQYEQMIGVWATPGHCSQKDDQHSEQRQWNREGQVCLYRTQLRPKCYGTIKLRLLVFCLSCLNNPDQRRTQAFI
jgi:hypothetical protein